jgi:hypothetical protein
MGRSWFRDFSATQHYTRQNKAGGLQIRAEGKQRDIWKKDREDKKEIENHALGHQRWVVGQFEIATRVGGRRS